MPQHDPEASGPAEELVEALCSLPQLPTLPVTTVRPLPAPGASTSVFRCRVLPSHERSFAQSLSVQMQPP